MSKQQESPVTFLGLMIWSIAALFFLYEFFLRTFVGSVAHQIIPDLHLNAETFALIGSAYYIAYGLMQVPVGILVDKFGVKLVMLFATVVCAGATFLFARSTGLYSALFSRLLMGFGSSFAFVCLLVIAATWFPRKNFGFFAGLSQFIGTMGPLLAGGPLVLLIAAEHGHWRLPLIEIGSFGVVLFLLVLFIVKNKPRGGEQSLIYLQQPGPLSQRLLVLVKNRQAWFVALYSATVYISIALMGAYWGTDYLEVRGLSQTAAASMISLAWLGYAVGCPVLGALSDLAKRRKPTLVFCAVLGVLATSGITYLSVGKMHWIYAVLFFCLGLAASGQNVGFATIAEHVDLQTKATALGLNNGAITLSGAFIPPLASYFIYLSASGQTAHLKPENFIVAFSVMPLLCAISAMVALFLIKETYCKPQKEPILLSP